MSRDYLRSAITTIAVIIAADLLALVLIVGWVAAAVKLVALALGD